MMVTGVTLFAGVALFVANNSKIKMKNPGVKNRDSSSVCHHLLRLAVICPVRLYMHQKTDYVAR